MLGIGGALFLQIPDESKRRILHPAKVVRLADDVYTAELEAQDLDIVDGQDLFIFYEARRDFLQQSAHVLTISGGELKPIVELETTGEPVSAESRQFYRVSAVTAGLSAGFGDEQQCPLLDVSCTGFSVVSSLEHSIGNVLEAELSYQDQDYKGKVSIQSIRELSKGRIRYGVHCVESKAAAGNMPRGLQQMTLALQSEQLRRLAGAT